MNTVLFACVHNAGRSQMAAAWLNHLCDPRLAVAISAGTQPAERVHPEVLQAMAEVGLDLSYVRPRLLTSALAGTASLLITMGCGEACPVVPGLPKLDWPLPDPQGQSLEQVRILREAVRERVARLAAERAWLRTG